MPGLLAGGPAGSSCFAPYLGVRKNVFALNTQSKTALGGEGLDEELPRSGMATRFIAANFGALLFAGAASLPTVSRNSVSRERFRAFPSLLPPITKRKTWRRLSAAWRVRTFRRRSR